MQVVRQFCLYRRRFEPQCFVPDRASFPLPHQVIRPYIFSETEVARLIDLSSGLRRSRYSPLRPDLFRLIIIILFTAGLRKSELLNLCIGDYNTAEGTLMVRYSKFHKSRLIPLRTDVCQEIDTYIQKCRDHQVPTTPETPLVWNNYHGGHAYATHGLMFGVFQLFKKAGILTSKGRFPRIHDFRHSFAVNALLRWYKSGVDVQTKLPFLAAYMGHVSIHSTYYYLHFIEPLASLASDRFARTYGALFKPYSNRKVGLP
jgi:integrase/recombinase XerD